MKTSTSFCLNSETDKGEIDYICRRHFIDWFSLHLPVHVFRRKWRKDGYRAKELPRIKCKANSSDVCYILNISISRPAALNQYSYRDVHAHQSIECQKKIVANLWPWGFLKHARFRLEVWGIIRALTLWATTQVVIWGCVDFEHMFYWLVRGLPLITYTILHAIWTPSPLFACNTQ